MPEEAVMRGRLFFPTVLLLSGCGGGSLCGNKIVDTYPNSKNDRIAYVFTRDCGATTGFATNVAIGRKGDDPANADIVFTADDDHGAALTEGNALWVRPTWTHPGLLEIAYAEHARVFRTKAADGDVEIKSRATGPVLAVPVP